MSDNKQSYGTMSQSIIYVTGNKLFKFQLERKGEKVTDPKF